MLRSWTLLAFVLLTTASLGVSCRSDSAEKIVEAREQRAAGNAANERGDWKLAIDAYSRAIDLDPGSASDHTERAYAYGNLGDPDAAIEDLTEAIRLEPDSPVGFNQRALYYNEQGR